MNDGNRKSKIKRDHIISGDKFILFPFFLVSEKHPPKKRDDHKKMFPNPPPPPPPPPICIEQTHGHWLGFVGLLVCLFFIILIIVILVWSRNSLPEKVKQKKKQKKTLVKQHTPIGVVHNIFPKNVLLPIYSYVLGVYE